MNDEPFDWDPFDWDPAVLAGLGEAIDLSGLDAVLPLAEPAEPRAVFMPLDPDDGQIEHLRQLVREYDQARRAALAALRAELQRRGYSEAQIARKRKR